MELYKNKYVICLYDKEETLCYQFDNAKELAEALGLKLNPVYCILSQVYNHGKNRVGIAGYRVEFVEVEE